MTLAELAFARGLPGESQRRYEQAAELAADAGQAAAALRWAAGAAKSRHFGNDALRLQLAAADAAVRAGDRAGAAMDLAQAAEMCNRTPGLMATLPPATARRTSCSPGRGRWPAGTWRRQARLLTAEAFNGDDTDPVTAELTERAIELARRAGDPLDRERGAGRAHLGPAGPRRDPRRAGQRAAAHGGSRPDAGDGRVRARALGRALHGHRVRHRRRGPADRQAAGRTGPGPAVPPGGGAPGHGAADRRGHPGG